MAGYAAAMRIERIEIRGGVVARRIRPDRGPAEHPPGVAVVELGGADLGEPIRRRLADLRIYLGQLTWYLFNAEGWR
jgi:hypothetical protein